jgi:hypothetical protein
MKCLFLFFEFLFPMIDEMRTHGQLLMQKGSDGEKLGPY